MQGKCKVIGTIYLVLGIIVSIWMAWSYLSILVFIAGLFATSVQVVTLYTLDEILENVSSHQYFVSGKTEYDGVSSYDNGRSSMSNTPNGDWKCPECGKTNASYVGTCVCGHNKE